MQIFIYFSSRIGYPTAEKMMWITEFGNKAPLISPASKLIYFSIGNSYFLLFHYFNKLVQILNSSQ